MAAAKPEFCGPRRPGGPRKGKTYGPRPGSRPYALLSLRPGERCFFEAKPGAGSRLMQQIGADLSRNGLSGKVRQSILLTVDPSSREVVELVMVTRLEEDGDEDHQGPP